MKLGADKNRRNSILICALLVLVTAAVYWQMGKNRFINYDDPLYVTENFQVQKGLTWPGVVWAFHAVVSSNWHPVTLLSHMTDVQLFGLNPAGHHLTNLFFHVANTLLLFGLLKRMTGAFWRSAIVAGLFALHPLHVESVAWVAERKDVLSTFFFLLTIWAYVRYTQFKVGRVKWYSLALVLFALGLMSKPMVVTLPFVLLLLDYWPLNRLGLKTWRRLLVEKIPFFVLTLVASAITLWAQHTAGSVISVEGLSVGHRFENAILAYWKYLGKTFWPSDLAMFYPYQTTYSLWLALVLGVALVAVSSAILKAGRSYLIVGWLWFLGTLVPVIGFVQVGMQAMADRYMYIPSIGLFMAIVFGLDEIASRFRTGRILIGSLAAITLAGCLWTTHSQVLYWRDSETLYLHAIEATKDNHVAYNNLGTMRKLQGKLPEAVACFQQSLIYRSNFPDANNNLGITLLDLGRLEESEFFLQRAIRYRPDYASAYYNLGVLRFRQGRIGEAIASYQRALAINDNLPEAHTGLGSLLAAQGKFDEAISHFRRALAYNADHLNALNNLGVLLTQQGKAEEALVFLKKAVQISPSWVDAHYNLGNAFLALKNPHEATDEYQTVLRLDPKHDWANYRIGNVLMSQGKPADAALHYSTTVSVNRNHAEAHYQLATILAGQKQIKEAIDHYREVVRLKPDWIEALNNLAWILATVPDAQFRDGKLAVELATRAVKLTDEKDMDALDTFAAACAESGRFDEALASAEKAHDLALQSGKKEQAGEIQKRMELYRTRQPFREPF